MVEFSAESPFSSSTTDPNQANNADTSTTPTAIVEPFPILTFRISDEQVIEGNGAAVLVNFTITLSRPSDSVDTVNATTADSSATFPSDYAEFRTLVTFAPGVTSQTVSVVVNGDSLVEANETFTLNLSNATNAEIIATTGIGTILDDDPMLTPVDPTLPPVGLVGPRVINLRRFGFHLQPTYLVVSFDTDLDPTRAADATNYRLVDAGADRRLGTRDDQTVRVTAAAYDPTNREVTLSFGRRLNIHRHYQIQINAQPPRGLANLSGALLDGNDGGSPGVDFSRRFDRQVLAGRASACPGAPSPSRVVIAAKTPRRPLATLVNRATATRQAPPKMMIKSSRPRS